MKTVIPFALVLSTMCSLCAAESRIGEQGSATAHLNFRITVPPVFRVLHVAPVGADDEYRVWTNMRSIMFNSVEYRFAKPGEVVLRVPRARDHWIVHGL
ncbi:MAG: hypothetical protein EOO22_17235 [Comamonadaceae bacterium]|nr:MAG: hypothetical protein EOO22_17235 [Comamonadaceae bacterium]